MNTEINIVNKVITSGLLGITGYLVGESILCIEEGNTDVINCAITKTGTGLTKDVFNIWQKFTPLGIVEKQIADKTFNKYEYKSVIGVLPNLSCNPNQEDHQGLCYNKSEIPNGYKFSSAGRFTKPCNSGERDDGISCWRDSYGRGKGYPWKFGDGLNDNGMFNRCEKDHGRGNCEKNGAVVYPKCKDGYKAVGCCICESKYGISNVKATQWVTGRTKTLSCTNGFSIHDGLCYDDKDLLSQGWEYSSPGIYKRLKSDKPDESQNESMLPEMLGLLGVITGIVLD